MLKLLSKLEKKKCFVYTVPYEDEFISIKTKTGREITTTKNHPFLVNDNGEIKWKKRLVRLLYHY